MIEAGLYQLITSSPAFSSVASNRLHAVLLPTDSTLPAATYQRISTKALYTLDGRVNLTQARFQFDTWAGTYADAKNLMAAINTAIDNYSGDLPDGTHVFGVQLYSCSDRYEQEARIYRVTADYMIQYADAS
jgi:hypothetical protein